MGPVHWRWRVSCDLQMSIGAGLPLVAILIKALPDRGGAGGSMDALTAGYGVIMFVLGSVISWPQTQNSAMFSEVCAKASLHAFLRILHGLNGRASCH